MSKLTFICGVLVNGEPCGARIVARGPGSMKKARAEHNASFHPGYVPPTGPKMKIDKLPPAAA